MTAKIIARIAAEITEGRTIQDAARVAAFKANAEAEAKGWSVAARTALIEDFAQAGVTMVLESAAR